MTAPIHRFRGVYRAGFATYLAEPGEASLRAAYELGREAVVSSLSVLDLALVHHETLLERLLAVRGDEQVRRVTVPAADFFVESLGAYEMVQRGFRETSETAMLDRVRKGALAAP